MSTELFIILHKVRGEPALDIAIKHYVEEIEETFWIIPTSGHRAYPHDIISFSALEDFSGISLNEWLLKPLPPDLPDHYAINNPSTLATKRAAGASLLQELGLCQPSKRFSLKPIEKSSLSTNSSK